MKYNPKTKRFEKTDEDKKKPPKSERNEPIYVDKHGKEMKPEDLKEGETYYIKRPPPLKERGTPGVR